MELDKPACYIANPNGFAEGTKYWYDHVLLPALEPHVHILDPWSVDVSRIEEADETDQPEMWLDLGDHHYDTIRDHAQMLIAILDGEPPDNGTVCEVVWAAAHNVPVIGYRNDLRTCGEDGLPYNLMPASAVRRSPGIVVVSLEELLERLPGFIAKLPH
ncbi:MAG TPA: nucleoside 2-deoxyribosyltransferase [Candidatus Saccharimonadales bacterium]|nr:nucleoside 2-deoxyribosyltransferase [Candidatus Saccharimonadales bacterium]